MKQVVVITMILLVAFSVFSCKKDSTRSQEYNTGHDFGNMFNKLDAGALMVASEEVEKQGYGKPYTSEGKQQRFDFFRGFCNSLEERGEPNTSDAEINTVLDIKIFSDTH
jgi:hypothetical protein